MCAGLRYAQIASSVAQLPRGRRTRCSSLADLCCPVIAYINQVHH